MHTKNTSYSDEAMKPCGHLGESPEDNSVHVLQPDPKVTMNFPTKIPGRTNRLGLRRSHSTGTGRYVNKIIKNETVGGTMDKTASKTRKSPVLSYCRCVGSIPTMGGVRIFSPVGDPIHNRTDRRGFFTGCSGFPPPFKIGNCNCPHNSVNKSDFLLINSCYLTLTSPRCSVYACLARVRMCRC